MSRLLIDNNGVSGGDFMPIANVWKFIFTKENKFLPLVIHDTSTSCKSTATFRNSFFFFPALGIPSNALTRSPPFSDCSQTIEEHFPALIRVNISLYCFVTNEQTFRCRSWLWRNNRLAKKYINSKKKSLKFLSFFPVTFRHSTNKHVSNLRSHFQFNVISANVIEVDKMLPIEIVPTWSETSRVSTTKGFKCYATAVKQRINIFAVDKNTRESN